jgi:hypothetical protein
MNKIPTILLLVSAVLLGCGDGGDGTTTLLREAINAQGSKKAILFLRESGATVPNSYQVSVTDTAHSLEKSEVGNTFTVDGNHGLTSLDSASIHFRWLPNDTLCIDFDKKLRTFMKRTLVDGVTILYQPR